MSSATKVDAGWLLGPVRQDDGQRGVIETSAKL
ncbi:hypothetical protein OOU_Y34scaffold00140g74 [Pyricularia oryzae Y34]|uniref:Uncharacterized protein n=2 Tax=Pyricularia oryzae TaxID=318829 RepID=A0AA97PQT1_PYRO3|nr:hypothetical protein OOU_Y34scaffold00140g74 [Pyricularia oryzae Y34]